MVEQMKEFEILDITAYITRARNAEEALQEFYRGTYLTKGDRWPEVRQLGIDRPSYFNK